MLVIRCDRCEAIVADRGVLFRFEMDVWDECSGRMSSPGAWHLCEPCGRMVAERLTEFARGLGLPHAGPHGVDQRRDRRPMAGCAPDAPAGYHCPSVPWHAIRTPGDAKGGGGGCGR